MTTVGTLYSSAARTTALDSIGGNSFDSTIPGLLQQAIVAVGNNGGGGGGGSTAWGAITGKPANVTSFGDLSNAAGVLTNNGSGTLAYTAASTGGNGESDAGKIAQFLSNGGINFGKVDLFTDDLASFRLDIGRAIVATVVSSGTGIYAELGGSSSQAFHAHVNGTATGGNIGFEADAAGGTGSNTGMLVWVRPDGYALHLKEYISSTGHDRFTVDAQGDLTWYANGTTLATGTDKTSLVVATPAGTNTITIPAETGTLALRGANTFTALQQFTGTTHAGLRLNNLTTAERDAIASPQAGMAIWNTTAARLQLHNGSAWTAGMVCLDGDTMTGALTIATGTVTASTNPLAITQTWNNAAVSFQGPRITITDTASSVSEQYFGVYAGAAGATKVFSVEKIGGSNVAEVISIRSTNSTWSLDFSATGFSLGSARRISWSSTVNYYDTNDLFLSRKAAATLQLGLDAAGVTNQMLTAASRITSDGVGADLTIAPGNGRGGAGGTLNLSTFSTAGASTIGTLTTRMTIDTAGAIAFPNVSAVTTETVVSDRTWPVTINGVAYKICLKA